MLSRSIEEPRFCIMYGLKPNSSRMDSYTWYVASYCFSVLLYIVKGVTRYNGSRSRAKPEHNGRFSLSQMSSTKLAKALPWRENVP